MNHDYDGQSQFCKRCGCGVVQVVAGDWHADCIQDAGNVVAISHLIAHRRMAWVRQKLSEYGIYPDDTA